MRVSFKHYKLRSQTRSQFDTCDIVFHILVLRYQT